MRSLLASRGIELPEGSPDDAPGSDTVCALGNRKNAEFTAELTEHGVEPYPGSLRFLVAAIAAGMQVAVVSSSANATQVLRTAGILDHFPVVVDGLVARQDGLAGKPAPDTYLDAAGRFGLAPAECVVVEDATSGVEAGRNGAFGLVVGVDRGAGADALREHGPTWSCGPRRTRRPAPGPAHELVPRPPTTAPTAWPAPSDPARLLPPTEHTP